jgi:hypothetical protein
VPPNPTPSEPTVTKTKLASFEVTCPVTGQISCRVRGEVTGPDATAKRAVTLATARGEVGFDETDSFTFKLSPKAKTLLRAGYDERAKLTVAVDGERLLSDRIRFNKRTANQFKGGGK